MVEFFNSANYSLILNNTLDEINITSKYIIGKRKVYNFKDFLIFLIDILMVTGPSIGYFLQCLKFKKTKSSKGFSKSICLIIYFAQILRIFFWIGKPFKITLLYQSILIIIFQIYLIYLWVKFHQLKPTEKNNQSNNQINDINYYEKKELLEYLLDWSDTISPNKIWNWANVYEYYKFMLLIVFFLLIISGVIGIHNKFLTNLYGTVSVISEVCTLIPQIIVSFRKKDSSNISSLMVLLWFLGDTCKFIYNIVYNTPIQMIISGGFSMCIDLFVLLQIYCYSKKPVPREIAREVEISNDGKSKQVQEINQFMNKLEESDEPKSDEGNEKFADSGKNMKKVEMTKNNNDKDNNKVVEKSKEIKIKDTEENSNNDEKEIEENNFNENDKEVKSKEEMNQNK